MKCFFLLQLTIHASPTKYTCQSTFKTSSMIFSSTLLSNGLDELVDSAGYPPYYISFKLFHWKDCKHHN